MYHKPTTLTEFILQEEKRYRHATGSFTLLLTQIEIAAKIIASHIRKTGLVDIIGTTGEQNIYSEEVKKIDTFSNQLLIDTLSSLSQVYAVASEELEEIRILDKQQGEYVVFLDPLDGSSNIDVNVTVGTIFSIYRKNEDLLLPGKKQIAAGYILYGPSVMFVYTIGNGVNGFTLDPANGCFVLSHPDITTPKRGSIYAINEGNASFWGKSIHNYIAYLKEEDKKTGRPYKSRYVGSLVADAHRTLLKGGIFLYPADTKNPQGKLRLQLEVNPFSYLFEQARGKAVSGKKNPLLIKPTSLHQKAPLVLGSSDDVSDYMKFV